MKENYNVVKTKINEETKPEEPKIENTKIKKKKKKRNNSTCSRARSLSNDDDE